MQQFLLLGLIWLQLCLYLTNQVLTACDVSLPDVYFAKLIIELEVLCLIEQKRPHYRQTFVCAAIFRTTYQSITPNTSQFITILAKSTS